MKKYPQEGIFGSSFKSVMLKSMPELMNSFIAESIEHR
jgi:hypothetical protein